MYCLTDDGDHFAVRAASFAPSAAPNPIQATDMLPPM